MSHRTFFPFSTNNNKQTSILFDKMWTFGYVKNNKKYVDLSLGSCGCFPLGFTRKDFVQSVSEKLLEFPFISGDFKTTNHQVTELTEIFYEMTGYHSMFAVSGSDAVEAAIKMADLYHLNKGQNRKYKFGFADSYHGSTFMSSSISGSTYMHQMHGRQVDCLTLSWDINEVEKTLNYDTSCIIVETCSWQAGLDTQTNEWWQRLKKICEQYDIILIIDDIAFTGFKTGKFFGYNVEINPDIVCFGKAVSAGYFPLSGCLLSQKVKSHIEDHMFLHGFSYSFNMSGILSALYYLQVDKQEGLNDQYEFVKNKYSSMFKSLPLRSIKNHGLMFSLGLENTINKELLNLFLDQGLYLGLWNQNLSKNNVLIQCPNVYDEEYADKIFTGLSNIIK